MPNPMGNTKVARACRWHMRYTRGVRYKELQRGQLAELQMDTISLQRDILIEKNTGELADTRRKSPTSDYWPK